MLQGIHSVECPLWREHRKALYSREYSLWRVALSRSLLWSKCYSGESYSKEPTLERVAVLGLHSEKQYINTL